MGNKKQQTGIEALDLEGKHKTGSSIRVSVDISVMEIAEEGEGSNLTVKLWKYDRH